MWIRFLRLLHHFIFTQKKKLVGRVVPNAPPNIGLVTQSFTTKAIWLKKESYTNKLTKYHRTKGSTHACKSQAILNMRQLQRLLQQCTRAQTRPQAELYFLFSFLHYHTIAKDISTVSILWPFRASQVLEFEHDAHRITIKQVHIHIVRWVNNLSIPTIVVFPSLKKKPEHLNIALDFTLNMQNRRR